MSEDTTFIDCHAATPNTHYASTPPTPTRWGEGDWKSGDAIICFLSSTAVVRQPRFTGIFPSIHIFNRFFCLFSGSLFSISRHATPTIHSPPVGCRHYDMIIHTYTCPVIGEERHRVFICRTATSRLTRMNKVHHSPEYTLVSTFHHY